MYAWRSLRLGRKSNPTQSLCWVVHRYYVKGKTASSSRWLERQHKDRYVRLASQDNYRSRSAYKLIQIEDKFCFLKKNSVIVDLGAAPGAWSQVVSERVNLDDAAESSRIIAVDVKDIKPIPGVTIVSNADVLQAETLTKTMAAMAPFVQADVILSDMAPSASGNHSFDHYRIMELARAALGISLSLLPSNAGVFLCKILEGREKKEFTAQLKRHFEVVREFRPPACRQNSSELYVIAWSRLKVSNTN
ncbi:ribosomal RNA large subunit methyltransferase E-like [Corticium candelabrum]|uniref:ribosomal RNA large subunit methyltransferase E-like n=1 Tax=Corticium candelabrum TaxID=121492 RepID=UPI002E260BE8|nr:ribosomal RNA large subunit methyltransferase E-like [Corticium candelabrum]